MSTVAAQWHNADESPDDYLLLRLYEGGEFTGERYLNGAGQGEHTLAAESMAVSA